MEQLRVSPDDIGRWSRSIRRATAPIRRWLGVEFLERDNVPSTGGVILAANHLSFIDSVLLMQSVHRPITFLGKVEYLSHWSTRTLFPRAGMIPVDRTGRGVGRSLALAADRLKAGEIVGIFPEGTRSRDGRLHGGHLGAAHLALRTGCPIVPVGITGTDQAMPPGCRFPRRCAPVKVHFAAPVDLGRWIDRGANGTVKREITDEVMATIASLTGQDFVADHAVSPDLAAVAA